MGYVSDRTQIVHALGSHRAKYKNLDIIVEPWRVANVSRYQYVAIPKTEYAEKAAP